MVAERDVVSVKGEPKQRRACHRGDTEHYRGAASPQDQHMHRVGHKFEEDRPCGAVQHERIAQGEVGNEQQRCEIARNLELPRRSKPGEAQRRTDRHRQEQPGEPLLQERDDAQPFGKTDLVCPRHDETGKHEEEVDRQIGVFELVEPAINRVQVIAEHAQRRDAAHRVEPFEPCCIVVPRCGHRTYSPPQHANPRPWAQP